MLVTMWRCVPLVWQEYEELHFIQLAFEYKVFQSKKYGSHLSLSILTFIFKCENYRAVRRLLAMPKLNAVFHSKNRSNPNNVICPQLRRTVRAQDLQQYFSKSNQYGNIPERIKLSYDEAREA